MLDHFLDKWNLTPTGDPIFTHTSQLLPVLSQGQPAMLKITDDPDEKHGHLLMRWWAGNGAAQVLAYDEGAVLLERATGPRSLVTLANEGLDAEATRIICDVARQLHAMRGAPPPSLIPLATWFEPLAPTAQAQGGILVHSAAAAAEVLASEREIVPLHGDLHHENILDFEDRGWLAIDPKRVIGERTFEYTILFCDPDLGLPHLTIARRSETFAQRLNVVSEAADLETRRLLRWILAWAGLSAAWQINDNLDPGIELRVAEMAWAALNT
ncbi:aminoglycoside phosphotransferase family protein [Microvirga sp. GCM10011540]|uniref:aminoglycoside phosphotransferase family protein n=1 Tax=Microvirga sp. GCM10011540 TaxID=3317338 RepID=UPI00361CD781